MTSRQSRLNLEYNKVWQDCLDQGRYMETAARRRTGRYLYYDIINKYIPSLKNPLVLELGCGTGIDINVIKERNECIKAFGADISFKSIQIGLKVSGEFDNRIDFFVSDVRKIPLKDNFVDIVFSQGLIEHFANPQEVVKEQMRILRNGGILIVNVPQKYTGYTIMKKRQMRKGKWQLGWEIEFSYNDLKKVGCSLGLSEKEVIGYQYWKSWKEPAFVLRDCYDKFHRRNPFASIKLFVRLKNMYDLIWDRVEKRWGHIFLQNIVIVFQKKENENTSS